MNSTSHQSQKAPGCKCNRVLFVRPMGKTDCHASDIGHWCAMTVRAAEGTPSLPKLAVAIWKKCSIIYSACLQIRKSPEMRRHTGDSFSARHQAGGLASCSLPMISTSWLKVTNSKFCRWSMRTIRSTRLR